MRSLRDEIRKGNHLQFHVFELSQHRSSRVTTHHDAMKYLKASGAHLMVYGDCRLRMHDGRATYVLELNASVRHAPIPIAMSRQFSSDMSLALPKKTLIPESDELAGFEFTRGVVGLAARYILGIACFISRDPFTAFDLHLGVRTELADLIDQESDGVPLFRNLNTRTANLLVQEGLSAANLRFTLKPSGYVDDMHNYLQVVETIDPSHYGAHLLRAIYYFLASRDIESARREVKKAKNERDASSMWSEAFLDAYDGKLEAAHKKYQRAFRGEVPVDAALQIETFIIDVLEAEPTKAQLWYCLGMINYVYKGDEDSAKRDFEQFLEGVASSAQFEKSVEFARQYLAEIQKKAAS